MPEWIEQYPDFPSVFHVRFMLPLTKMRSPRLLSFYEHAVDGDLKTRSPALFSHHLCFYQLCISILLHHHQLPFCNKPAGIWMRSGSRGMHRWLICSAWGYDGNSHLYVLCEHWSLCESIRNVKWGMFCEMVIKGGPLVEILVAFSSGLSLRITYLCNVLTAV